MLQIERFSVAERLAWLYSQGEFEAVDEAIRAHAQDDAQATGLMRSWGFHGRPAQMIPGTYGAEKAREDWTFWLLLAGRGFGKTRTGAETVKAWAEDPRERILMIAPTANDVSEVMIHGESGLLSCYGEGEKPRYYKSRKLIVFPSGATGIVRSADEPERLRGPQFTKFWCDEFASWRYAQEAWDQIQFGFRLKSKTKLKGVITTTPRPIPALKAIIADAGTVITRGSSYDNRTNLADEYFQKVIKPYEGTRLGRQEIEAELLEDVPGALWTRGLIDATRIKLLEVRWDLIVRIVVAVDPAVSHHEDSAEHGIIVAGLTRSGHVVIIDDLSMQGTPEEWRRVVKAAYLARRADRVIGEVNNGGDLVESNMRTADPNISFRSVRASRGKYIRAEPVAALYEQGRVHHVGCFGKLEDQMCQWTPLSGDKSPDRMDALVWAITELVVDPEEIQVGHQFVQPARISAV